MGAVLQTAGAAELVAELTCCACSSVCGLVTRDRATRAKFRYCSFLLLATVTCVILLIPGLRTKLDKIPNLCNKVVTPYTCDKFVGFSAVYRILISLTIFHFLLAILTIRVTRVKSFRAKFNNGLWLFKMGLIFGLTIASFYIPKKTGFFRIWMYISLTGGFMFVMFQILLMIDFGHSWSMSWAEKLETGYTKLWYLAMAMVTLLMFAMSFGAMVSFYIFFTHPPDIMKCHANVFYITFIGIQCFLATVVSVTPSVQQELTGAGLLQSSVVILYTMYLTWNTLSSEPDSTCNPVGNIILEYDSLTGVSGEAIFGCLLTLVLLLFACTVRASTSHLGRYGLTLAESEDFAMATYHEDKAKENVEKQLESGEKEISLSQYVGYNYSFFHIIMSLASLHILMVLTNWHSPEENSNMKKLVKNWASVWVQMASSFVCILVYVWFLVTPLIKKVWGPMFGIVVYDELKQEPTGKPERYAPNLLSGNGNSGYVEKLNSDKEKKEDIVERDERIQAEAENSPRPKSRNTFDPQTLELSIPKLRRRGSEESIVSAVSVRSMNTYVSRKSKRREKLLTVDEKDSDTENGIPKKVIIPNIIENRRKTRKHRKSEKEIMYSSSESIASRVSSYVKRNFEKLKHKKSVTEKKHEADLKSDTIDRKKLAVTESADRTRKQRDQTKQENINSDLQEIIEAKCTKQAAITKKIIVEEEIIIETKLTEKDIHVNNSGFDDGEVSIVPSVFKRKSQGSNVARGILKLQWKILRTQAKVVKIQERIIRLQAEAALAAEEIEAPPAESSFVNQNGRTKQNKHTSKEHG